MTRVDWAENARRLREHAAADAEGQPRLHLEQPAPAATEPLAADENGLVVGIDRSPEEIVAAMLAALDRSDAG